MLGGCTVYGNVASEVSQWRVKMHIVFMVRRRTSQYDKAKLSLALCMHWKSALQSNFAARNASAAEQQRFSLAVTVAE